MLCAVKIHVRSFESTPPKDLVEFFYKKFDINVGTAYYNGQNIIF